MKRYDSKKLVSRTGSTIELTTYPFCTIPSGIFDDMYESAVETCLDIAPDKYDIEIRERAYELLDLICNRGINVSYYDFHSLLSFIHLAVGDRWTSKG